MQITFCWFISILPWHSTWLIFATCAIFAVWVWMVSFWIIMTLNASKAVVQKICFAMARGSLFFILFNTKLEIHDINAVSWGPTHILFSPSFLLLLPSSSNSFLLPSSFLILLLPLLVSLSFSLSSLPSSSLSSLFSSSLSSSLSLSSLSSLAFLPLILLYHTGPAAGPEEVVLQRQQLPLRRVNWITSDKPVLLTSDCKWSQACAMPQLQVCFFFLPWIVILSAVCLCLVF